MKKSSLLLALCLAVSAFAQPKTDYLGPLQGPNHRQKGFSYQGMDICKGYIFSLQDKGIASIYRLEGKTFSKVSSFHLDTYDRHNHSNVASFGREKAERGDRLPVVYVSQCHRKPDPGGRKDVCYVERIAPGLDTVALVQTIFYDDTAGDFGYALQWVVDTGGGFIYGYGNTVNNHDKNNRHRVIKFRLPKLSEGPLVVLRPQDALEDYLIEDVSGFSFNPIGQGLYVRGGKIYMPTGIGTEAHPSILYVWDLRRRKMEPVDLSAVTTGELEDISFWRGHFYVQGQEGIWKLYL